MDFFLIPSTPEALSDAIAGVCWILTNVLLISVGWRWARRFFPQDSYLDLVGHTVILGWGTIVVVAFVLGNLELLTGPALLVGVATISAVAILTDRVYPAGELPNLTISHTELGWLVLWTMLGGLWSTHVVINGLLEYPSDWDSLAYHLPMVDQWLQARSLWAADCNRWANPGNNELLALWAAAPFSGDFLVAFNNLPATILLGCGGVALAAQVGLHRSLAHLAGFALVCHYVAFKQIVDQENDVAVAACFIASLMYVFRYHAIRQPGTLALGAISLGLLAGVKYYALGYAALLLIIWVILATVKYDWRAAAHTLLAGIAGLLVFAGFWYIRNWLVTGTPLYPKGFSPETDSHVLIYPDVTKTSFFGNGQTQLLDLYIKAIWRHLGPCQFIGFLMVPISVAWLFLSAAWQAKRRSRRNTARVRVVIAMLVIGTGLVLGITPMAVEDSPGTLNQIRWGYCPVRYGLCFLSIAFIAACVILHDLMNSDRANGERAEYGTSTKWRRSLVWGVQALLYSLFGGSVVFQLLRVDSKLHLSWINILLPAVNLLLIGVLFIFLMPQRRWAWLVLIFVLVAGGGWMCANLSERWHQKFITHYDEHEPFAGISSYSQGEKPRSTLVLQMRCYPYIGSRREHRIHQPVYIPSTDWVLEYIRVNNITVVVTEEEMSWAASQRYSPFIEYRNHNPNRFSQINSERQTIGLFEVVPNEVSSPNVKPSGESTRRE